MKLKIAIYNRNKIKSVYVDDKTNHFTIDDVVISKGATTFIQTVLSLVKNWPETLVAEEGGENNIRYKIAYEIDGVSKLITADGKLPEDFYKLSNLIFSYENPILYRTQLEQLHQNDRGGR